MKIHSLMLAFAFVLLSPTLVIAQEEDDASFDDLMTEDTSDEAEEEDTSEVINTMLSIDGVEVGLLFRETADGRTKISLRSKHDHDVNTLALAHGGGGHKNAAGAVVNKSLEACSRLLVAEAETLLG